VGREIIRRKEREEKKKRKERKKEKGRGGKINSEEEKVKRHILLHFVRNYGRVSLALREEGIYAVLAWS
jgi:hypothetical protein